MEGPNRPLEGIERVKHAWPAGCWLDSTVLSISCFQIFSRISRIFIWQAAADQSAAAGSIMKFQQQQQQIDSDLLK